MNTTTHGDMETNNINYCISGSYSYPVKSIKECTETPFSMDYAGRITYNGEVLLTRYTYSIFGTKRDARFEPEMGDAIVMSLNKSYQAGYEAGQKCNL